MELVKIFEMICKLSKLGNSFIDKYLMIPEIVPYAAPGVPKMTMTKQTLP